MSRRWESEDAVHAYVERLRVQRFSRGNLSFQFGDFSSEFEDFDVDATLEELTDRFNPSRTTRRERATSGDSQSASIR